MVMNEQAAFVGAFREAAPYIHHLRGKTLVVCIAHKLLAGETLSVLASDLNLLHALGIRLLIVPELAAAKHADTDAPNVVTAQQLQDAFAQSGAIRHRLQAALSLGFAHSPQHTPRVRISSGNYLTAQPLGIIHGTDCLHAGKIRKIDSEALQCHLQAQHIVLADSIAASPSGVHYLLDSAAAAAELACALQAEKLVYLQDESGIVLRNGHTPANLTLAEAEQLLGEDAVLPQQRACLSGAARALRHGVNRVQILSGSCNGDLLRELFTRHGAGTSIAAQAFLSIRPAQESDIADILALIEPLVAQGVLLARNHDYLEQHNGRYFVLEHDRQIYGCIEYKTFPDAPDCAELAGLAVSPEARQLGYGEQLLQHIVRHAQNEGRSRLLALSTHTADWFVERGFRHGTPQDLPAQRRREYEASRRASKVFVKTL